VLDASEAALLRRVREAVFEFISVDDFAPDELRALKPRVAANSVPVEQGADSVTMP
jgi:acyl-CoA dehydrogenase